MSDPFAFLPQEWSERESEIWNSSFGEYDALYDPVAQALYNEGYFNFDIDSDQRAAIRDALDEYMSQEYGIDFDDVFDWDAWRDAYGSEA